jgi:hypothetical protein
MKERTYERRNSQSLFYDAIQDRRRRIDRRDQQPAAVRPGVIRPGVGEAAPPFERRRYLDSGME